MKLKCEKKLCKHHGSTRTGCEKYWNPSSVIHSLNLKNCDDFDVTVKQTNCEDIVFSDGWNVTLNDRRIKNCLPMDELARLSQLSEATVLAVLTKGRKPRMDTLRSICKVLGFKLSDIISGNTDFVRGNYNA